MVAERLNNSRVPLIRPEVYGEVAAAGVRRREFDCGNEILISHHVPVGFLFIGDSITHYWELQSYFSRNGAFIVNRGISGDTSLYVRQRFEADVLQLKPRYAVIQIGVNNFKALDTRAQTERDAAEAIAGEIAGDIRAMAAQAKENGIVPVIGAILPTNRPDYRYDELRNQGVRAANRMLRRLSEEENLIFVDYHSPMAAEGGNLLRDGFSDDGVHPHVLGYDVMAKVLRMRLSENDITI